MLVVDVAFVKKKKEKPRIWRLHCNLPRVNLRVSLRAPLGSRLGASEWSANAGSPKWANSRWVNRGGRKYEEDGICIGATFSRPIKQKVMTKKKKKKRIKKSQGEKKRKAAKIMDQNPARIDVVRGTSTVR